MALTMHHILGRIEKIFTYIICYMPSSFPSQELPWERIYTLPKSDSNSRIHRIKEIKRCLLVGRNAMTNLDSIFKSRDVTLSTKVHLVKAMAFPIVIYGHESWTIKKAECWRIDAFKSCCWRRLLRALELQGVQTNQA